jgi:tetratricopeptide (TPR) repeat protein
MTRLGPIVAVAVWLAAVSNTLAFDQVKTTKKMLRGRVLSITAQQVDMEEVGATGLTKQVPVNEVITIFFEDEPSQLQTARKHMNDGDYEQALVALDKIPETEAKRKEIVTEIEYAKALCAARMALAGSGDVADAGKKMVGFVTGNANSFHYLEACELIGNLLVARGNFAGAEKYYAVLAQAPWPDYKMRAKVALGRALLAQGKLPAATKAFQDVISDASGDELAEEQRSAAQLGKARCLAAGGQADQAIKMVEAIIAKADSENVDLNAQAYNALGTALRKAGKAKEALLAFLHVDLLYSSMPDAHAEALANMVELFTELHKPDHAKRARQVLEDRYKSSPWATNLR